MDIRLSRCNRTDCPTCCAPRILKVVDRIIRKYEHEQLLKREAAHDARMRARKMRQSVDPAMKLVQRKA